MAQFSCLVRFLILHFFVGLQEGMELVIEINLSVFHRNEYLQLLFEHKESLVSFVLLSHKIVDISSKCVYIAILPVLIDGHSSAIDS